MAFDAFREPDYRRFWTTQFLSNIGSWMQAVAQGWLVYRLTDSPFLLGFVAFAGSAPTFVLMLPGGVLADQWNRRRVVAISQGAQALAALAIAISVHFHTVTVWQICAAAAVAGTAMSFSAPAWQAMIVDLLEDRQRLPNALMMNSLQFNLSRAIGPVIAGIALSSVGAFWCFLLNALSFIPLIIVLGRIRDRQEPSTVIGPMWTRLTEGFRYVRRERVVLILLGVVAASSFFGYPFMNLMPVIARSLFTNDAAGLGWLIGGFGTGAFAGALALSFRTPTRYILRTIVFSLLIFGVSLGSVALARTPVPAVALLVISGAAAVVSIALCNTSIQHRIADEMRGRVLSMYTFAFFTAVPFGNLVAGSLAEHRGIRVTIAVMASGLLLSGVIAGVLLRRRAL
jgi:MFS family permease